MSQELVKSTLLKMGYKLKDCGNHWRTNALYRGGTNPTALLIYKDTGVWTDFVKNSPCLPLKDLVSATLKTNDSEEISKIFDSNSLSNQSSNTKPKVSSEKIYPEEILTRLLPHYIFYKKKGIDEECLSHLKCGLATSGNMYQRFVFPIYNSEGKIHGFSGRDMLNSEDRPKWKLLGKKNNWVYPAYMSVNGELIYKDSIIEAKSVILVESIGDMLALHSCGYKNTLVTFGTSISSKLLCFILGMGLDKVYISLNNDSDKESNRGRIGSLKILIKLLNYFSFEKLFISPPSSNDFGDMTCEEIHQWKSEITAVSLDSESITNEVSKYHRSGEISKLEFKSFNKNFS